MAAKKRNPNGSGNISQRKDGRYELKVFVDSPDGRRKRISIYASTWEDADDERTRLKDSATQRDSSRHHDIHCRAVHAVLVDGDRATERAGDDLFFI